MYIRKMQVSDILGEKPTVKILAYMVEHPQPMHKKDYASQTKTSTSTAATAIDTLAEAGLVEPVGEGLYPKYQPVMGSKFMRKFKELIETSKEQTTGIEDRLLEMSGKFRREGIDTVLVGPFLTKLYGFDRYDERVFVFAEKQTKDKKADYVREYKLFYKKTDYGGVRIPEREDAILAYAHLVQKGQLPLEDLLSIMLREQNTDWAYVIERSEKWHVKDFIIGILSGLRPYAPNLPDLSHADKKRMGLPPELIKPIKEKLGIL
ncbi:MAG: hypothetical protein V1921_04820 [Candidatus Altiarchaeota archaeon]